MTTDHSPHDPSSIAILHDRWTEMGGAEHVAVEMARTFDAPIYVGSKDDAKVPDDVDVRLAFNRWFENRAMRSHYLVRDFCQMFAWQHVSDLHEYDTLILNKNNPGWYIPKDDQTIVKFTHSTPRQPYDLFHKHGESYLSRMLKQPMRVLYRPNITYPDVWACNSDIVQHRVEKYWGIPEADTEVIYPPVDVASFGPHHAQSLDSDYYFTMSRLVDHKRITDIVEAFNKLGDDYQLKIGGDGPLRDRLEEMAGDNVELLGYLDEGEKRRRMAEAKAFVFAAENEDFGMVPIEAMASGTPVVGVRDGFTEHQILDRKNGILFAREGTHLRVAVELFDRNGVEWDSSRIQQFASRFSADRFRHQLRKLVSAAEQKTEVDPDWQTDGVDDPEPVPSEVIVPDGGDA